MPPNNESTIDLQSKSDKSVVKPKKHEEIYSIKRKLEKMTKSGDHGQALDLLERLGDMDINFGILKDTMIGFAVHALRKSTSDEEIILKSKSLIKVQNFLFSKNYYHPQKSNKTPEFDFF